MRAVQVFRQKGFHGASMSAIVEAVNLQHQSFFISELIRDIKCDRKNAK